MNFCGIVSEFNPFHNGHNYLINMAKQITGLPCICAMSGDFVQRGEPAITDKYTRAKCAITAGADAVVQIPTIYSLSNAQNFAYGAIKTLKELGCSHLVIGVTHTKLEDYYNLAKIKNLNIKSAIKNELDKGENYSKALINILKTKYKDCDKIFTDASNILALEYIEQVINQKAKMQIVLINRTDGGYNSKSINKSYANASTIRSLITQNKTTLTKKFIPDFSYNQLDKITSPNRINDIIYYNLRTTEPEELQTYYDYTEGLHYLLSKSARASSTLEECINSSVSKRYRLARIKKLCIYPSLNITKDNVEKASKSKIVSKLLAIKKDKKEFISQFNKKGIKVIVSNGDYDKLTKIQQISAQIDLDASNLYTISNNTPFNNDIKVGTLFLD